MSKKPLRFALAISALCALILAAPIITPQLLQNAPINQPATKPLWETQLFCGVVPTGSLHLTNNGQRLIARSWWGHIAVLDAEHGNVLSSSAAKFPPVATFSNDGRWLARVRISTGRVGIKAVHLRATPCSLDITDVQSGVLRHRLLETSTTRATNNLRKIVFSNDNQRVASFAQHNVAPSGRANIPKTANDIHVWNTASGRLIHRVSVVVAWRGHKDDYVNTYLLSNDGAHLYSLVHPVAQTPLAAWSPRLRDEVTGREIALQRPAVGTAGQPDYWRHVTLSPDGKTLVAMFEQSIKFGFHPSEHGDGTLCAWELPSGHLKWERPGAFFSPCTIAFSLDSQRLALGGSDSHNVTNEFIFPGRLMICDAANGKTTLELSEASPRQEMLRSQQLRWSHLKDRFSRNNGGTKRPFLPGDSGEACAFTWTHDGKALFAAYLDGSVKMWRVP